VQQRQEIRNAVAEALESLSGDDAGAFHNLSELSAELKKEVKDMQVFKEGYRFVEAAGFYKDWPNNRGLFVNDSRSIIVLVNEREELNILITEHSNDIHKAFE
jgi:hypothetical protein